MHDLNVHLHVLDLAIDDTSEEVVTLNDNLMAFSCSDCSTMSEDIDGTFHMISPLLMLHLNSLICVADAIVYAFCHQELHYAVSSISFSSLRPFSINSLAFFFILDFMPFILMPLARPHHPQGMSDYRVGTGR